jgi:predicted RNA binding protein YcfA (HicA-like mRNA interferase family)
MPKKYPPLTDREIVAILLSLGFIYSHSNGGHDFYKASHSGKAHTVTVDPKNSPFAGFLLKSMIAQSGYDYKYFYAATKKTAKKIGVKHIKNKIEETD